MIRREPPLVVVAFNFVRSTGRLGGWAATGGPGPPFKPVELPAPTGPGRFLDVRSGQRPHNGRPWRTRARPQRAYQGSIICLYQRYGKGES